MLSDGCESLVMWGDDVPEKVVKEYVPVIIKKYIKVLYRNQTPTDVGAKCLKGPAGLAVKPLDLHDVIAGSIPVGHTQGKVRLQGY